MKAVCRIEEWCRGSESTAKNSPERFRGHFVIVNPRGHLISVHSNRVKASQTSWVRRSLTLPEQIICKYFIMNGLHNNQLLGGSKSVKVNQTLRQ